MSPQTLFADAPVISSYSRAQAIEDGVLVDVSATAKEAGFRYPVAVTRTVWEAYVAVPPKVECQDEAGRLWDILWMLRVAIGKSTKGDMVKFGVYVRNDNRRPKLRHLKSICGPGDTAAPVITVMMPDED